MWGAWIPAYTGMTGGAGDVSLASRSRGLRTEWAPGYMAHLQTFDDVELVAVCDPLPAARDGAGDEFGVSRRYADVDELLDSETLDAIFVITPAHLNASVALRCLERGVNTEVTKPPGLRVAETQALRAAATRTGAKAMVSWSYRFHPLVNRALALVRERGPVVQVVGSSTRA